MIRSLCPSRTVLIFIISCTFSIYRTKSFVRSSNIAFSQSNISKQIYRTKMNFGESIKFDNHNLRDLPIDSDINNRSSRQVKNAIFSRISPVPVVRPRTVAYSVPVLKKLGIESYDENEIAQYFSGNKLFQGSEPAAHCYCGHQFGSFAGQLGDGTVIYLGEVVNNEGERWEVQLKGAGQTPYSRNSDGRKVLRSSIREFLASEAMHGLSIPTTRAAACVTSDTRVDRDPLYDGHVIAEQCTVVARVASNFFRFGSFEIFKLPSSSYDRPGPSAGNEALKKKLADHIIAYYPPEIRDIVDDHDRYHAWFQEIVRRTARLVGQWQAVGWVHGVLNTDNMSIMGLTIDYGPYAFLEAYDEDFTSNGSDGSARYAYGRQPDICRWNLQKLLEAITPLLSYDEGMQIINQHYQREYDDIYHNIMTKKFGLKSDSTELGKILSSWTETMSASNADYTDTFQALTLFHHDILSYHQQHPHHSIRQAIEHHMEGTINRIVSRCATPSDATEGLRRKMRISKLSMPPKQIQQLWQMMQQQSDAEISRLFQADPSDIRKEVEGEMKKLDALMAAAGTLESLALIDNASKRQRDTQRWQAWMHEYVDSLYKDGYDDSSISSDYQQQRYNDMRASNPTFILRNWVMQDAIDAATMKVDDSEDYCRVRLLLEMINDPYNPAYSSFLQPQDDVSCAIKKSVGVGDKDAAMMEKDKLIRYYCQPAPAWAPGLVCTCSS